MRWRKGGWRVESFGLGSGVRGASTCTRGGTGEARSAGGARGHTNSKAHQHMGIMRTWMHRNHASNITPCVLLLAALHRAMSHGCQHAKAKAPYTARWGSFSEPHCAALHHHLRWRCSCCWLLPSRLGVGGSGGWVWQATWVLVQFSHLTPRTCLMPILPHQYRPTCTTHHCQTAYTAATQAACRYASHHPASCSMSTSAAPSPWSSCFAPYSTPSFCSLSLVPVYFHLPRALLLPTPIPSPQPPKRLRWGCVCMAHLAPPSPHTRSPAGAWGAHIST